LPVRNSAPAAPTNQSSTRIVKFAPIADDNEGHRILIYGPGGVGKTTLCCELPGESVFYDFDLSLKKLKRQLIEQGIKPPQNACDPDADFAAVRASLQSSGWDAINNIIFDTTGRLEELAVAHTLKTVTGDQGKKCYKIEDYGFGKGYRHVYDVFLPLFGDLDRHVRAGRNVVLICHDDTKTVPNPAGLDWIRWEPKMQDSRGSSIRLRAKEWSDHCLFFGYDVRVDDQGNKRARSGKGKGAGSRVIYTAERPHFMAKSRTTSETIVIGDPGTGGESWSAIINK
jgi:GTPase SAR1 family protein